jgi:7-cyano-7-deazaguanine synthase
MVEPRGIAVLASGGVESGVLLHHAADLGEPVQPLFVRQGFRWERAEVAALTRFLEAAPREEFLPLEVLVAPLADLYPADHFGLTGEVPAAGTPDEDCYLPGRNLTLLPKAAVFAAQKNLRALALGSLGSNPFPDAGAGFFARLSAVLTEGLGHPIEILAPLAGLGKPEVVTQGRDLPLELTLSCMDPVGERNCGRCSKCWERQQGFADAGLPDRTPYG